MSTASALMPGARCAADERLATGVCSRCGDYLCGRCGERMLNRLYCKPCVERLTKEHSRRSVQAYVLGIAGVHGLFFLSPIAAVLGIAELGAIRGGSAPSGGRGLAMAGAVFGVLGVLMPVSILLAYLGLR